MFAKNQIEAKLDAEIISALEKLEGLEPKSEEYAKIIERVTALYKMRTEGRSKTVSPDTVLIVAANIFGILWLSRFERENVIKAPKAFGSIIKPR